MNAIHYSYIQAGQVKLHVASAGPKDGEPVMLLHGFPDASFGWDKQITFLADAGYRVYAPDQRGYGHSDKPKGIRNYQLHLLVDDILALADNLRLEQFDLVGHDFGAFVSWLFASKYPERLKRMVIMNVPHPTVMYQNLRSNPDQRRKSWYMFFFQLPFVPESRLRADNYGSLASIVSASCTDADRDRYREAWSQPGALTAMINWYRNVFRPSPKNKITGPITIPTLMIWGKQDMALSWEMAKPSIALCENGRLEYIEDASHWVHQDAPETVNRLMLEHIQGEAT